MWRAAVRRWATEQGIAAGDDRGSLSLRTKVPATGRRLMVKFSTTQDLLVAGMTDEHFLGDGEMVYAVAAANAWNATRTLPAMSVWDVRGRPFVVGVCTLPLTVRVTDEELAALVRDWIDQACDMYAWCHDGFKL